MYPEKVLQEVPDRERTVSLSCLDFLIMAVTNPQPLRHLRLRQARFLAGLFQYLSHALLSLIRARSVSPSIRPAM